MKRRHFLPAATAFALAPRFSFAKETAATAIERAHEEIWRRFIDRHGILIDFADLDGSVSLPTPEECRLGKPNALGWWSPIENGSMFNGMYLEAMVNRWKVDQAPDSADKARRLMRGLLYLNSISDVAGFVGRGVSTDGKSHYPMGSNDQTFPWFYGLWRYWESGIATAPEKQEILDHLTRTADAIAALKWQMPAEVPFGVRGGFGAFSFEGAPRLLFLCKLMHHLTGASKWEAHYRENLEAKGGQPESHSRLEWCEIGMTFEGGRKHSWTSCNSVCGLLGLWELETEDSLRARFLAGLRSSATLAAESFPIAEQWNNDDASHFEHDWRVMNEDWKPQQTEQEAQSLAEAQLRAYSKLSPRRGLETRLVREPCFAAWVVTLSPDREQARKHADGIERVISRYDYRKLIYSQFFPVESAWWRLKLAS